MKLNDSFKAEKGYLCHIIYNNCTEFQKLLDYRELISDAC